MRTGGSSILTRKSNGCVLLSCRLVEVMPCRLQSSVPLADSEVGWPDLWMTSAPGKEWNQEDEGDDSKPTDDKKGEDKKGGARTRRASQRRARTRSSFKRAPTPKKRKKRKSSRTKKKAKEKAKENARGKGITRKEVKSVRGVW